jgi:hypothetical protein
LGCIARQAQLPIRSRSLLLPFGRRPLSLFRTLALPRITSLPHTSASSFCFLLLLLHQSCLISCRPLPSDPFPSQRQPRKLAPLPGTPCLRLPPLSRTDGLRLDRSEQRPPRRDDRRMDARLLSLRPFLPRRSGRRSRRGRSRRGRRRRRWTRWWWRRRRKSLLRASEPDGGRPGQAKVARRGRRAAQHRLVQGESTSSGRMPFPSRSARSGTGPGETDQRTKGGLRLVSPLCLFIDIPASSSRPETNKGGSFRSFLVSYRYISGAAAVEVLLGRAKEPSGSRSVITSPAQRRSSRSRGRWRTLAEDLGDRIMLLL